MAYWSARPNQNQISGHYKIFRNLQQFTNYLLHNTDIFVEISCNMFLSWLIWLKYSLCSSFISNPWRVHLCLQKLSTDLLSMLVLHILHRLRFDRYWIMYWMNRSVLLITVSCLDNCINLYCIWSFVMLFSSYKYQKVTPSQYRE